MRNIIAEIYTKNNVQNIQKYTLKFVNTLIENTRKLVYNIYIEIKEVIQMVESNSKVIKVKNKCNEGSSHLIGEWLSADDEWFSFYCCSNCGYKTMDISDECPACKATMK